MKKLISLCLVMVLFLSLSPALSAAKAKKIDKSAKVSLAKRIKVFIGEPIYCRITEADLEQARKDAKDKKIAKN